MSFIHTFCQLCDMEDDTGDDICQSCNDLCLECCLYNGQHPPSKCPDEENCNYCAEYCTGCVFWNHTVKTNPHKTYGGEKISKCEHFGKSKKVQREEKRKKLQEELTRAQDRVKFIKQELVKLK